MRVRNTIKAKVVMLTAVGCSLATRGDEASAASLVPVGVLDESHGYSMVMALSPDGMCVVGGGVNAAGFMAPFLWQRGTGTQALPNPGDQYGYATGVDVRPAVGEIVIAGQIGYTAQRYNAPLSGTGPWLGSWAILPGAVYTEVSSCNSVSTSTNGDKYYIAGWTTSTCYKGAKGYRYRGSSTQDDYWDFKGTGGTYFDAVASTGVCVGSDSGGSGARSLWAWQSGSGLIPSLSSEQGVGQGIGISPDGTWMTGGSCVDSTNYHAFLWKTGQTQAIDLSPLAMDTGSVGYDVTDDGVVVGYSCGTSWETRRAAVWDRTGTWDTTGQGALVMDVLTQAGVDLGDWAQLTEAVSISADGLVIAGNGVWASDGSARGWVAVIPEPTTIWLALAAGFGLLQGRKLAAVRKR